MDNVSIRIVYRIESFYIENREEIVKLILKFKKKI